MGQGQTAHRLLIALGALAFSPAALAQGTPEWPPALQPLPDSFAYRTPQESLATFTLPPGYSLQLVASEPLIGDSILMDWDFDGRLWVVETTFMSDLTSLTAATPTSDIVILDDTDGDGAMDTRTVFAADMILPRALLIIEPGVALVAEPPYIRLLRDTDGDLVADENTIVHEGYGVLGGVYEHDPNGLYWNIDNLIYNAGVNKVFKWSGSDLFTYPAIARSQWGVTADDEGRILRQGNSAAPSMSYVSDFYFGRNSVFSRTRGNYEWLGGPTRDVNAVFPIRPTPGVNRGYQEGILRPDGTLAAFTSAGGLAVYRGDALPVELLGDVFVPEPAANLVARLSLDDTGTGMSLARAYEQGEFITSIDERFRPIQMATGPDGALYVLDLYHGVIQDAYYVTNYLRDWIVAHGLDDNGGSNARVYRVVHDDSQPSPRPQLSSATADDLVALLGSSNGWYRDHAQRLLVARQMVEAVPALTALFQASPDPLARLHAIWTIDGLRSATPDVILAALQDESRAVRVAGIRIAEDWLIDPTSPVTEAFLSMIGGPDSDWNVVYQLSASAGSLGKDDKTAAMLALISAYGTDFVALDAAMSGLSSMEAWELFQSLAASDAASQGQLNALTTIATALVQTASAGLVAELLDSIGDASLSASVMESALLGVEIALGSGDDPGAPMRLPRQQLGPFNVDKLGDPAYPQVKLSADAAEAAATPPASPLTSAALQEVDGIPTLTLPAEPRSFLGLAPTPALAERIDALSPFMTWPGKPPE